jgi:hypothetical protein
LVERGLVVKELAVGEARGVGNLGLKCDVCNEHRASAGNAKFVGREGGCQEKERKVGLAVCRNVRSNGRTLGTPAQGGRCLCIHDTPTSSVVLAANHGLHGGDGIEDVVNLDHVIVGGELVGAGSVEVGELATDETVRTFR